MDLKQRKLNRSEWDSIEIPVPKAEIDILNMIVQGYHDVNIRINNNNSIFSYLKIEFSEKMESYLFNKYFRERAASIEKELKKIIATLQTLFSCRLAELFVCYIFKSYFISAVCLRFCDCEMKSNII
jgi:hypothetical protein